MCTAAAYMGAHFCFGRNLDYERGFGEQVTVAPRRIVLPMRYMPDMTRHYAHLSPKPPENRFAPALDLEAYSRGMGALGLPGDLSSQSRFVRAAFTRMNSVSGEGEGESISQLFHILGAVAQQRGCCVPENGRYELTLYTPPAAMWTTACITIPPMTVAMWPRWICAGKT